MKEIIILGSTGSIGTQALKVVEEHPEDFSVVGLACKKNVDLLIKQIEKFKPTKIVVEDEDGYNKVKKRFPNIEVLSGKDGLNEIVTGSGDFVINALVGIAGLEPTLKAIEAGKTIGLANKETLVTGGQLVMDKAREKNIKIIPIDSEHSAIFQCLKGNEEEEISRIILTASGGPFRSYAIEAFEHVKLEQALRHPNWQMGQKITIDSATMMNKGLEVLEAKWLFGLNLDKIEVAIHPESIIHSMVEYEDGAILAQMGLADMKVPIQYALTYPNRMKLGGRKLNLFKDAANLTFEKPDLNKFRCLKLAYEVGEKGGSYPIVLNGANEVLVQLFLEGKIRFVEIARIVEKVLNKHNKCEISNVDDILECDKESRIITLESIGRKV